MQLKFQSTGEAGKNRKSQYQHGVAADGLKRKNYVRMILSKKVNWKKPL